MKISEQGLALVRTYEGLRLKAYRCRAGKLTIGYGHTRGVTEGMRCTKVQAETWLAEDAQEAGEAVLRLVKPELTQGQFDALVSFVFNFGEKKFSTSTLLAQLNVGASPQTVAQQFGRWIHAVNAKTGEPEILNGLVLRRQDEKELFLS